MKIKATRLRQNLYQILDQILDTGLPVEIERKGKILLIQPGAKVDKLNNLKKRSVINGKAEDLLDINWECEWSERGNLK